MPIPPATPECRATDLDAAYLFSSAATGGNVNTPIGFRDRGSAACYLEGYPDILLLDGAGSILATASGAASEGTYFNDGPVVPILLEPGTLPLSAPPASGQPPSGGQAFINVQWFDCRRPTSSKMSIDLPHGGGRLTIPFAVRGAYYPTCDTSTQPLEMLARGPFSPTGIQWPPGPSYLRVGVAITAPPSVKSGSTLVYYVTVQNMSQADYVLSPCPDYVEILGSKLAVAEYQLNCAPVGRIAPGGVVRFEMRMAVPSDVPRGTFALMWALIDGRLATPHTESTVEVT